jgi:glycosyltransferase involved in cell wall biosynthesis
VSPLISCILPTHNRRPFLEQALRIFSRRTYREAELIVIDDGDDPTDDLCAGMDDVRYMRLNERIPAGAKMNLGIEAARGDILQKLDDDDYYGPDFLSMVSERLLASDHPRAIAAWCCFAVLIAGEPEIFYSGHGWQAGGTLCFRRALWEQQRFRETFEADPSFDSLFIRDTQAEILRVCAPEQYMLVRHGGNTWHRIKADGRLYSVEEYFRGRAINPKALEELVGEPQSSAFYRSLMRKSTAYTAAT